MFQICALREIGTERERRQTIGRGLRLCVNQKGERLRGFDINTLTVIATESYEEFAENLQKEIEKDTGIKFGIVEKHQQRAFSGRAIILGQVRLEPGTRQTSRRLCTLPCGSSPNPGNKLPNDHGCSGLRNMPRHRDATPLLETVNHDT